MIGYSSVRQTGLSTARLMVIIELAGAVFGSLTVLFLRTTGLFSDLLTGIFMFSVLTGAYTWLALALLAWLEEKNGLTLAGNSGKRTTVFLKITRSEFRGNTELNRNTVLHVKRSDTNLALVHFILEFTGFSWARAISGLEIWEKSLGLTVISVSIAETRAE